MMRLIMKENVILLTRIPKGTMVNLVLGSLGLVFIRFQDMKIEIYKKDIKSRLKNKFSVIESLYKNYLSYHFTFKELKKYKIYSQSITFNEPKEINKKAFT